MLPVLFWTVAVAAALGLGRYATPTFLRDPSGQRPLARLPQPPSDMPTLLYQLGVGSVTWYAAAVSFPFLVLAARRINAERFGRGGAAAIVVGGTLLLIVGTSATDFLWSYRGAVVRPPVAAWIPISLRQHVLPWIALTGIVAAVEARRRTQHTIIERERLRAAVAEQRLIALAGQLRPHFLFNSLQAISTLLHRNPEAADEMLGKLSDLLRDVLRHRDSAFVGLGDEVRYARTWLEIAKVRFADRLTFEIDVPPETLDLAVPLFILQPLVENALAHGIGGVLEGGRITIRSRRKGERLRIEVEDNGAGLGERASRREGIGLSNTRERLHAAYGSDSALTLSPGPGKGTIASITVPARSVSRNEAAS